MKSSISLDKVISILVLRRTATGLRWFCTEKLVWSV